jgi:hypothetical protein
MKHMPPLGWWKRSLQVLLSISLAGWFLAAGLVAPASSGTRQAASFASFGGAAKPVNDNRQTELAAPDVAICQPSSGTECYSNWSGYVAGNGHGPGFDDVFGNWNVECVTTGSQSPADSEMVSWVGLGGFYPNGTEEKENLWQAGPG